MPRGVKKSPVLKVKKMVPHAKLPVRMTKSAAGLDVFTVENKLVPPGKMTTMRTGIAVECPEGHYIEAHIRSSWGKKGIRFANCTGIIDEDFRGEVMLYLYNDSSEPFYIKEGTRIAQLILKKRVEFELVDADELTETDRGLESGSTGNE